MFHVKQKILNTICNKIQNDKELFHVKQHTIFLYCPTKQRFRECFT